MTAPAVPAPRLQQVRNLTPFRHFQYDKMGPGRRFSDVVIVCASFVLAPGRLEPAPVHRGPVFADVAWDAAHPALSSLRAATDLVLEKPEADVFITGSARARHWTPQREWHASLEVSRGDVRLVQKTLRLTGPRGWHWHDDPAQCTPADPEPTLEVPLRWELAFGGCWHDEGDAPGSPPRMNAANPSGLGCFGTAGGDAASPAPRIEAADAPVVHANQEGLVPAGFGPVARHWMPRVQLAGTYDDAWLQRNAQAPFMDYADDFDPRFFQYAPIDQRIAGGLAGNERLRLTGFFASADAIEMTLPHWRIGALWRSGGGTQGSEAMMLDTAHLDLDDMLVHLTWRLSLAQARDIVAIDLHLEPMNDAGSGPGDPFHDAREYA